MGAAASVRAPLVVQGANGAAERGAVEAATTGGRVNAAASNATAQAGRVTGTSRLLFQTQLQQGVLSCTPLEHLLRLKGTWGQFHTVPPLQGGACQAIRKGDLCADKDRGPGGACLFHPGSALLRPPHGDRVPGVGEANNSWQGSLENEHQSSPGPSAPSRGDTWSGREETLHRSHGERAAPGLSRNTLWDIERTGAVQRAGPVARTLLRAIGNSYGPNLSSHNSVELQFKGLTERLRSRQSIYLNAQIKSLYAATMLCRFSSPAATKPDPSRVETSARPMCRLTTRSSRKNNLADNRPGGTTTSPLLRNKDSVCAAPPTFGNLHNFTTPKLFSPGPHSNHWRPLPA
ncbi:uncharacterized protein LOC118235201 isoform X1 [Anguilla anguilla]|uniref:uncharacterized protein LOC118235201 isoform X1 n=1 Tax=Anguilla anguilla TaxID=7936 RepID=UPI0015AD7F1D|nr:uncharacterized protein LOC118235201 isoform X1 [Anguilla anguilla]